MRVIELPLLHDHHSHVSLYAALSGLPDLSALSPDAARACLSSQPGDRLGLVKGWRSDRLTFGIGDIAGLPPLIIINFSLHGFVLTSAALPYVETLWPELARNYRDVQWTEGRLPELFRFYGLSAGFDGAKLAAFMAGLASLGIGSVEDLASLGAEALAVIGDSPYSKSVASWASPACYRALGTAERGQVVGFKLFLDGSIGARSAAIDGSYLGGGQGRLLYADAELEELVAGLSGEGKALAVHAIGHRAIRQILDILETCGRNGLTFPHVRLEHVQFIGQDEARRAKELGLCLSMQPNFNSDSRDYADRLPGAMLPSNNPFRMLIDELGFVPGKDLVFGSDGMPHGIAYALESSFFPPFEGQELRLEEVLAGYGKAYEGRVVQAASYEVDYARRSVHMLHCGELKASL